MVERNLAKVEVDGSNPFARSRINPSLQACSRISFGISRAMAEAAPELTLLLLHNGPVLQSRVQILRYG